MHQPVTQGVCRTPQAGAAESLPPWAPARQARPRGGAITAIGFLLLALLVGGSLRPGSGRAQEAAPDHAGQSSPALQSGVSGGGAPTGTAVAAPPARASRFSPERLFEDVATLADDRMEGRGIGTAGLERAAAYIAAQFAAAGLTPAGDNGAYFQSFRVPTGVRLLAGNHLRVNGRELRLEDDFVPLNFAANGAAGGGLVFAGFGITAPEIGYDDYAGIDVAGKIVMVLRREPRERDQQSPFRDPRAYRYSEVRYKLHNARQHGAAGVLVVDLPDPPAPAKPSAAPRATAGKPPQPGDGAARRPLRFDERTGGASAGILAVYLHHEVATRLLRDAGASLEERKASIDATLQPASLEAPGVSVELVVALEKVFGSVRNVVGWLPGQDATPRREVVVIGAHYDHLGYGDGNSLAASPGRAVHNGADDNASGVAGVLALARSFAARRGTEAGAPRSLLFAAFAAEELGVLGSTYFVKHPPGPLAPPQGIGDVAAMLNLDMIGRLRQRTLHVQGVDSAAGFRSLAQEIAAPLGLQLKFLGEGYGPSDHTPFYAAKVPVLFFFTGPHSDYHKPSDDATKINAAGMAEVVELVARVAERLAASPRPQYVAAKTPPARRAAGSGGGYGPRFGIVPDFSEFEGGVLISGVGPGTPADSIGLRTGDVITRFAGVPVYNLYDFTYVLRSKRAGDEVEVTFRRDGGTFTKRVTLERRR